MRNLKPVLGACWSEMSLGLVLLGLGVEDVDRNGGYAERDPECTIDLHSSGHDSSLNGRGLII